MTSPAYLVAEHRVENAEAFEEYRRKAAPLIEQFGGQYITRGGSHRMLGGEWQPTRAVIIRFPDRAALEAWYASPDYALLVDLRRSAGPEVIWAVDGV
ncbi:DUF1330 domain-containing protein [Paucibacter sp. KBW04]|uniref:DUF1330 domain-containing protein n=1 Tax=Paucibacter sp. KBW04 TaxID=2153361 RepID=UPI000F569C01|nr:DUF1330 domain-containing protein [Paucibacter sp. KBW04]RQO59336.1 DUF1330 domain-containing protein [Paucibacter sp. KBW04]